MYYTKTYFSFSMIFNMSFISLIRSIHMCVIVYKYHKAEVSGL